MAEIRALIVDDEPLARRGIRQMLARERDVIVLGECRDGHAALRALDTLTPDLVFLDIQMPELDGFGVIREHGADRMPTVVFVTAYDEFAVRAFEAEALDYLVKPISPARFAVTMTRVRQQLRLGAAKSLASQLHAMLASIGGKDVSAALRAPYASRPADGRGIVVPTPTGVVVVDVNDVDWIEAEDYYVRVHAGTAYYLLRDSLTALERRLDVRQFVRVHRRALLRLDRVRELQTSRTGETVAILRDGTRVPVSRRRSARLTARLRVALG